MIVGIGHDLVEIGRVRKLIERFEQRFASRVFNPVELEYAYQKKDPVPALAMRFAAKEACAKALGTGIGRNAFFREIEVVRSGRGAPSLSLTGRAAECLQRLVPSGYEAILHLSLSDEVALASAFVVIELRSCS